MPIFLDSHFAVGVRVEQVEVDLRPDAAGHAGPRDAEIELGSGEQSAVQLNLGYVDAVNQVADEEAVEQRARVDEAALDELLDAERVIAEVEVDFGAEFDVD